MDPDRRENRFEIWRQKVGLARRPFTPVTAVCADDDHRPVLQDPDLTLWCRTEGAADANDMVDPCLQGRRYRKIVHRCADHNEVGSFQFADQTFRQGKTWIAIRYRR